jgi:dihydrolipoamide dehydrogenase
MASYDLVVIGAGPGGYVAAIRAAQLGGKVAVVEDGLVGGTCLNWGCIPSKALIRSGRVAALIRHSADFGVTTTGMSIDYGAMAIRKDRIVSIMRDGIMALLKARKIDLVAGRGKLASPTSVEVTSKDGSVRTLEARAIIIATGSAPARPKMFPFDCDRVLTSDDAVSKKAIGKSCIVVGGGFIGCEYASLYANLGVEVTVVELLDSILATMDDAVIKEVGRGLKKRKVKIRTGVKVEKLEKTDSGVTATLEGGEAISADFALISVGRRPMTQGIGLEEAGVTVERGFVQIDDRCRTNVPSVYAIGDITGKLQLAHVASEQGVIAAENIMGHAAKMDYSVIPACVFTDPEAAMVGINEREAKERGLDYRVGQFPFRVLGKAHADGEIDGTIKVIGDAKTDKILGVHIIGHGASEIIGEAAVAMKAGATIETVVSTIHAHPTLPEGLKEAFENFEGKAIHLV